MASSPLTGGFKFLAWGATTPMLLELSIEIFTYLWDKEFIGIEPPPPGGGAIILVN
jgi:hypothetical protein